jgi:hypothetical protein
MRGRDYWSISPRRSSVPHQCRRGVGGPGHAHAARRQACGASGSGAESALAQRDRQTERWAHIRVPTPPGPAKAIDLGKRSPAREIKRPVKAVVVARRRSPIGGRWSRKCRSTPRRCAASTLTLPAVPLRPGASDHTANTRKWQRKPNLCADS